MSLVLAGCAATDEYVETPPQPSEMSSSERALPPITVVALKNCIIEGASRLSRHSYELSFEVETTGWGVVRGVDPKGSRLDDAELETCMIHALEAMSVREFLPADESFQPPSQSMLPSSRSLLGTTALLPEAIRLVPVVIAAPGGITIVVGVAIIVAVATVTGGKLSRECQKQWDDARKICEQWISSPGGKRGLTGGYTDIDECARGYVDERCKGNEVDWGKQGRPGRRY